MEQFDSRQWRGRTVVAAIAILGCLSLVALPVFGLLSIDEATERSHRYTELTADVDQLNSKLLALTTGPLAAYGTTHEPAARDASEQGLAESRVILARIEAADGTARDLGINEAVGKQVQNFKDLLAAAESYIAEIDAGKSVADAPSTAAVVGAAGKLLDEQGRFAAAIGPARLQIDNERRDAVRRAEILLGVAVAVALVTIAALGLIDGRLLERRFAGEASRREKAERLAAHRADVVNMASHELRNPLTVLTLSTGYLKRVAQTRADSETAELADDAHAAALRCQALVDELLDLSRLDADRLQLRVGPSPVAAAIDEAVDMSRVHYGDRTVVISGDRATTVNADANRLRIIVRNLIDNAFKYSPEGSTIRVQIEAWEDRVRFSVIDEGVGIPETAREQIFERFERLSPTAHLSGVGIGLYLSRELARRMDGELKCRDSERGASFLLELPLSA